MEQKEQICCPRLDSGKWDEKNFDWKGKKFVKTRVFTLFYMPLNFGSVMKRMSKVVDGAGATFVDGLCLANHTSKWNMDLYLAVDKEIDGVDNVEMSGKFISKVYEGDFSKTGEWTKDFEAYAKSIDAKIEKMYMWYTTCPKCAKKYGKNYIVFIAKV